MPLMKVNQNTQTERVPPGFWYVCEMPEGMNCGRCDSRTITPIGGKTFCHGCGYIITKKNFAKGK